MLYIYSGFRQQEIDSHLCQLFCLSFKNDKLLLFGVPESLFLTNSRSNNFLWFPSKLKITNPSLLEMILKQLLPKTESLYIENPALSDFESFLLYDFHHVKKLVHNGQ